MNATMNGMLQITDDLAKTTELAQKGQSMVLGIQTIETGVFGGIVTGILTDIYIISLIKLNYLPIWASSVVLVLYLLLLQLAQYF